MWYQWLVPLRTIRNDIQTEEQVNQSNAKPTSAHASEQLRLRQQNPQRVGRGARSHGVLRRPLEFRARGVVGAVVFHPLNTPVLGNEAKRRTDGLQAQAPAIDRERARRGA